MPHFYVNPKEISNNVFTLTGEQFHYLTGVRRFSAGEEINIFDGLGNSFRAKIKTITKTFLTGEIISALDFILPAIKITLFTAMPKGERFEWLIEKCAELGVSKIVPVITARSVINEISENKFERYKKISISASSQSNRADLMAIEPPLKFKNAVEFVYKQDSALNLIPWECEESNTIDNIYKQTKNINIFIGPEGGFENSETEYAFKNNITPVTLGKNILRVETAALAACILVINKS